MRAKSGNERERALADSSPLSDRPEWLGPRDIQEVFGVGRTKSYQIVNSLPHIRVGELLRVNRRTVQKELLADEAAMGAEVPPIEDVSRATGPCERMASEVISETGGSQMETEATGNSPSRSSSGPWTDVAQGIPLQKVREPLPKKEVVGHLVVFHP